MSTLQHDQCADTPGPDNDPLPDAWPFDFNDDKAATLADVLRYIGKVNTSPPNPAYNKRFDFNASSSITLSDVLQYIGVVNKTCTP